MWHFCTGARALSGPKRRFLPRAVDADVLAAADGAGAARNASAVFAADLAAELPRAPEDVRNHWGVASQCAACPFCAAGLGAFGDAAELLAFRCGHIFHAQCAALTCGAGEFCPLCEAGAN